jgi:archaellum component FlaG (FlaF/FlaG flagellin family)
MTEALYTIIGMFILELLAVIFYAGKLTQKVTDIEMRLNRMENRSTDCKTEAKRK